MMEILDFMIMNRQVAVQEAMRTRCPFFLVFIYLQQRLKIHLAPCQKSVVAGFLIESAKNCHLPCTSLLPTANHTIEGIQPFDHFSMALKVKQNPRTLAKSVFSMQLHDDQLFK